MEAIAHYNILEPIGVDGIGEMFRARDTKVGRTVAIKIVGPRLAGDPEMLARLVEDATQAAQLSHPNVATLWKSARPTAGTIWRTSSRPGGG